MKLSVKDEVNNLNTGHRISRIRVYSAGLSLIELIVVLAVFALVTTLAVPNFRNFVQNNQMSASANNLMGSLALARSEAIKRNQQVSVCASNNQTSCTGVDWNNGWIVFVDSDNPGVVDGTDEIINVVQGLPGGMDLSSTDPYIQFKPNGSLAACGACLLDIGTLQLASLAEAMRGWVAGVIYHLIPVNDVLAGRSDGGKSGCKRKGKHACPEEATPDTGTVPAETAPTTASEDPVIVQAQTGVEMILCDDERTNETGRRFFISISGHINVATYACN
ncbi:hypothetical protein MNBD_GAMMA25-1889 [hydrothermal vent metagenome]|uniref:General secretion pathway GspH domain-containing protein n=1 Tax=hydrothermal vent metagenome TaxID=652676 RepID=A0A3B1B347_9ZZZZ